MFSNLYRFRQRENKNNLEDWFTECLAATLRSLDENQWTELLREILSDFENAISKLDVEKLTVKTQVQAGSDFGIPDLVVYHRDKPTILFENKVAHSVSENVDEAGQIRSQLHRYADWLDHQIDDEDAPKQLVFLTHLTSVPADFQSHEVADESRYHFIPRISTTWGRLGRQLLNVTGAEGERSLSHSLASAFYEMLEEENMSNEFPTSTDFAALEVYLAQGGAMENLVQRMWAEIAFVANSSNQSREHYELAYDYGRYCVHRYVNRTERTGSTRSYLMTGVWFPEVEDTWPPEDLGGHRAEGPQIFLQFADDKDDVFEKIIDRPSDAWLRPASDFLRLTPLYEFTGSPDERATKILHWLAGEAKLLRDFLLREGLTT